jgi:polysaccharide pyruvyl transferase WcaK-like protein
MNKLRIALYGNFGKLNLGNECTLRATVQNLKLCASEAELFCICSNPDNVSKDHGLAAVAFSEESERSAVGREPARTDGVSSRASLFGRLSGRWRREVREFRRAFRLLNGARALILVGTGMLEDEDGDISWPLVTVRWVLAARLRRCRIIALSIGVGPFSHWGPRLLSIGILKSAHYVSYRDQECKDYVARAGLGTRRHSVVPDLAFSLAMPDGGHRLNRSGGLTIGVGVIDRSKFASDRDYLTYVETLAIFVQWLGEKGIRVRVIHGDGLYDGESLRILRQMFADRGIADNVDALSVPSIGSLDDLLEVLGQLDLVVASRYHNMILALMVGKPVIALSYHWKFDSVMRCFQLSDYVRPVGAFSLSWLQEQTLDAASKFAPLESGLLRIASHCRSQVMRQYELIGDLIRDADTGLRKT